MKFPLGVKGFKKYEVLIIFYVTMKGINNNSFHQQDLIETENHAWLLTAISAGQRYPWKEMKLMGYYNDEKWRTKILSWMSAK